MIKSVLSTLSVKPIQTTKSIKQYSYKTANCYPKRIAVTPFGYKQLLIKNMKKTYPIGHNNVFKTGNRTCSHSKSTDC